ncbi:DUF6850 family outer membrane beta-barrel protein [Pedobacter lithocola]|uniref:DUF6850 family outer membrane beta-barrel protein n=1 Tax=Pedobacter lithocola TaxID=1908239 RepID=A0ABV8PGS7_9SPHI
MRKSIYAILKRTGFLLLLMMSAILSARSQSKTDSLLSLSLGIGNNAFSLSSNPIFIRHTAIPTFAEVGLRAELTNGTFRRPQDFKRQRNFGFGATGLSKVGDWLFYGSFSYGKNYRDSIKYANVARPYSGNPFITADAVGGNWRGDGLDASLQIVMPSTKKWQTAIKLDYETEQNSRDNDPKPLNRLLNYTIQPSLAYKFGLYNTLSILAGYSYMDEMVETGYYADQNPIIYSLRGYGEFTAGPVVTAQRFTKGYGYLFGADYLYKNDVEFLFGLRYGYQTQDVNDGIAKPIFIGGLDEFKGEAFASYTSGSNQNGFNASAKAWFRDGTGFDPVFSAINPAYYFSGVDTKIAYWKKRDRYIFNFAVYPGLSYTNYNEGIAKTDWTSVMLHQDAGFSMINQLTKKTTFGGELKLGYHFNLQKEIIINRPTQLSPILVTPYYQFASADYLKGAFNLSVTYRNANVSYQLKTGIDLVNTVDFGSRSIANLSLNLIF